MMLSCCLNSLKGFPLLLEKKKIKILMVTLKVLGVLALSASLPCVSIESCVKVMFLFLDESSENQACLLQDSHLCS